MSDKIVHDAEYYIVEVQNKEKWAAEDQDLDARPETTAIGDNFEKLRETLPFDPLDFIKFSMPDELRVTSRVDAVD